MPSRAVRDAGRSRGKNRDIPESGANLPLASTFAKHIGPTSVPIAVVPWGAAPRREPATPKTFPKSNRWSPNTRFVEPAVTTALPGATLGNRLLALTAWLHYALGNTLGQIGEVLNFHLQMPVSSGGLLDMWRRLAALLYDWYEQIHQEALDSAVLHAD